MKRGLIGDLYANLRIMVNNENYKNSFVRWQEDIEGLDEEDWTRALETLLRTPLSPSQRLSQLFIIHRALYTPQKHYAWEKYLTPLCPRCSLFNGSLIHMLW